MILCPCCSGKPYSDCCGPFINGENIPNNPEALMRSRYTAYSQANIDYIAQTMKGPAAKDFNKAEAKQWATAVKWLGLKVITTKTDQSKGWVEFIASYSHDNTLQDIHELSEFHLEKGTWYYVDGKTFSAENKNSTGRNESCPCGSNKKFKKCCGARTC